MAGIEITVESAVADIEIAVEYGVFGADVSEELEIQEYESEQKTFTQ